jgi:hypothetical protein
LATARRSDDEEVRISWQTYEGRPFLSLRLWKRSSDGSWWPDKTRGISIRLRELPDVAEGLAAAMDLASDHYGPPQGQRRHQPAAGQQGPLPGQGTFDEFESRP